MTVYRSVVHLNDLLLRCTLLAYLGHLNIPLVEQLSDYVGDALEWTTSRKADEIHRTAYILLDRHQVSMGT